MIRLKSIDNFRGITIIAMLWLHLSEWWISGDFFWFMDISLLVVNYVFWVSFQFISGISTILFYKSRIAKIGPSELKRKKTVKREFILRALLLLIVSLIYNAAIALTISNPLYFWSLFILLSLAISLIMMRPLLDCSKLTKLCLGILFMGFNFIVLSFLQNFEGQFNLFGVFYHILFYPITLHPIFSSFAAFLIGSVVGELLYDIYTKEDKERRRKLLKRRIIIPSLVIGGILIVFVYSVQSAQFLNLPSFYHIISSMGISLILFSIFIIIEEYEVFKTKKSYKFIFYYSYYSLTIYLVHNLLYFLFFGILSLPALLFLLPLIIVIIGLLLQQLYKRTSSNFALKVILGKLAHRIARIIEEKEMIEVLE